MCVCVCVCICVCACASVCVHDFSTSALHTSPHDTCLLERPSNGRAFAKSSPCVNFVCRIRVHNYIRAFRAYINSRACVVSHTRMFFYFSCACVRLSSSSTYLHTRVAGVAGVDIAATAVDFFFALFLVVDSLFFVSRLEFHCLNSRILSLPHAPLHRRIFTPWLLKSKRGYSTPTPATLQRILPPLFLPPSPQRGVSRPAFRLAFVAHHL
mmetsp:Transcript_65375/g.95762  ORF Transcript_65375/g.95762 Transcript_65375/m.95762 type:complete len:211 (+) Transcript_65375:237-869(+)